MGMQPPPSLFGYVKKASILHNRPPIDCARGGGVLTYGSPIIKDDPFISEIVDKLDIGFITYYRPSLFLIS